MVGLRSSQAPEPEILQFREEVSLAPAKPQVERRDHEEVEQRRGDQAAQDDDRHRVLDLVARDAAGDDQRHQGQARSPGRSSGSATAAPAPRAGPARAERLALLALQMLVVADQHDPVAGRDPQDGEEADQRAERDDADRST